MERDPAAPRVRGGLALAREVGAAQVVGRGTAGLRIPPRARTFSTVRSGSVRAVVGSCRGRDRDGGVVWCTIRATATPAADYASRPIVSRPLTPSTRRNIPPHLAKYPPVRNLRSLAARHVRFLARGTPAIVVFYAVFIYAAGSTFPLAIFSF